MHTLPHLFFFCFGCMANRLQSGFVVIFLSDGLSFFFSSKISNKFFADSKQITVISIGLDFMWQTIFMSRKRKIEFNIYGWVLFWLYFGTILHNDKRFIVVVHFVLLRTQATARKTQFHRNASEYNNRWGTSWLSTTFTLDRISRMSFDVTEHKNNIYYRSIYSAYP